MCSMPIGVKMMRTCKYPNPFHDAHRDEMTTVYLIRYYISHIFNDYKNGSLRFNIAPQLTKYLVVALESINRLPLPVVLITFMPVLPSLRSVYRIKLQGSRTIGRWSFYRWDHLER